MSLTKKITAYVKQHWDAVPGFPFGWRDYIGKAYKDGYQNGLEDAALVVQGLVRIDWREGGKSELYSDLILQLKDTPAPEVKDNG